MIPAGAITDVRHDDKTAIVSMTKDQVKSAPDYDDADWIDETRDRHADYYNRYSAW